MNTHQLDDDTYFVGNVIKLLTSINVPAACKIANNLKTKFDDDETIDKIPNHIIFNAYLELLDKETTQ